MWLRSTDYGTYLYLLCTATRPSLRSCEYVPTLVCCVTCDFDIPEMRMYAKEDARRLDHLSFGLMPTSGGPIEARKWCRGNPDAGSVPQDVVGKVRPAPGRGQLVERPVE